MKSLLGFLIIFVAVSQISAKGNLVNVTVFYQSLEDTSGAFVARTLLPIFKEKLINGTFYAELVPFGRAKFTEDPFNITCEHGPLECRGNLLHACFIAKNPNNYQQIAFITCTMSYADPAASGQTCAQQLGFSFDGVQECMNGEEGIALQIKYGKRTVEHKPPISDFPMVTFNNFFNEKDYKQSLTDLKGVIIRKLKEMNPRLKL